MLTREQILAANDTPTRDVFIPEWGDSVRVRSLSARDRDAFELAVVQAKHDGEPVQNIRARYAAACIVNDKGVAIFSEEDIAALGDKSAAALDKVYSAIEELNHLSADDIEALAKN